MHRDRSNYLVVGNKPMTYEQVATELSKTTNEITAYWRATQQFVNTEVRSKMRDIAEFKPEKGVDYSATGLLSITQKNYEPVPLAYKQDYRTYNEANLVPGFYLFVSKALLCGNRRLAFTLPLDDLKEPITESRSGNAYTGFMLSDLEQDGNRKSITYTSNPASLTSFVDTVQKGYIEKRKLSVFISDIIRFLEDTSRRLLTAAKPLAGDGITDQVRSAYVQRVRYHMNIINGFIEQPLIITVRYFDRLYSAADGLLDANLKVIETATADMTNKKKELGI